MVFITVQNLVGIDAVVLIICAFFDFASLVIRAPKLSVFRVFDPLNGEQCEKFPKSTSLRESSSFEPSCVKSRRRV